MILPKVESIPPELQPQALLQLNVTPKVQIRAEYMNAMNHPMFNGPNTDPYNTAFGQITSSRGYPRRIQLGAKLIF